MASWTRKNRRAKHDAKRARGRVTRGGLRKNSPWPSTMTRIFRKPAMTVPHTSPVQPSTYQSKDRIAGSTCSSGLQSNSACAFLIFENCLPCRITGVRWHPAGGATKTFLKAESREMATSSKGTGQGKTHQRFSALHTRKGGGAVPGQSDLAHRAVLSDGGTCGPLFFLETRRRLLSSKT
jgi:hypothetical protein